MADLSVWTDNVSGPTYATGGQAVVTSLAAINNFTMEIKVRGNLPEGHVEWTASGGTVTWKWIQHSYDKLTDIGNMNGLPSGITAASASDQTYDANTAHVHSIAHDHGATTSGTPNAAGAGVETTLGSGNYSTHTHSFDVPNLTGNSGTTTHAHTWNNIYDHTHTLINTTTAVSQAELANGTDLTGATLTYHAVGTV